MDLTKALADLGVKDGVRVNAINPGSIATDRLRGRIDAQAAERNVPSDDAASEMARAMKIARFGEPEDIARVVAFLASPVASYCQGTVIDVDGGANRGL